MYSYVAKGVGGNPECQKSRNKFILVITYGTHQLQLKRDMRVPHVCRP